MDTPNTKQYQPDGNHANWNKNGNASNRSASKDISCLFLSDPDYPESVYSSALYPQSSKAAA